MKDGYCWCDMCGFVAKLPAEYRTKVEDDHPCPDCVRMQMPSLLCVGDELEPHVIPEIPMPTWPVKLRSLK